MKIIDYLEKIYDSIYKCRLRLLKTLDEKGAHATGSTNVLSEWGIISIINGYYISELNTMTIRQIMHLRRKPGSVIYNADYSTLNRSVTLMKSLNPRYQDTKLYKANIIRNTGLYGWMTGGQVQWFHNMGVYVGPDNMPVITLNGGATWDMIDLSELYSQVKGITKIKASIASSYEIIFFTIFTSDSIHIYALSSKSFGALDYTWLVQADLGTFDNFTLVPVSNSDTAELILLNGGSNIILDVYGKTENEVAPSLHHFLANINEYGTILTWREKEGYFSDIGDFSGQFIVSKSFMSNYGLESVRTNYTEFLLTTDNNLHMIMTAGNTDKVPITRTFSYSPSVYGQLTSDVGSSNNIQWIRCTYALLTIQNNRNLTVFPFILSFTLVDASVGVGTKEDGYLYVYQNSEMTRISTDSFIDKNIIKVAPYAGQRSALFLHRYRGEFVNFFDESYTLNHIQWINAGVKDPAFFRKISNNALFSRTRIASNGKGTCIRYYENNVPITGYTVSYDSGATWHLVRSDKKFVSAFYMNRLWFLLARDGYLYYGSDPEDITNQGAELAGLDSWFEYHYAQGVNYSQVPVILNYIYENRVVFHFSFIPRLRGEQIVTYPQDSNMIFYEVPYHELTNPNAGYVASMDIAKTDVKWTNGQHLIAYDYDISASNYTLYQDGTMIDTISSADRQICGIYINPEGFALMDVGYIDNSFHTYEMNTYLPLVYELKSGVGYVNENDIVFQTLSCNDLLSIVGNFNDETKYIAKTSDTELLVGSDYTGGVISSTNVDQFHQGIAEYIDTKTGKLMHYHGRLLDIQSLSYMSNLLTDGIVKEVFYIGDTLYAIYHNEIDGYFLTTFLKDYGFVVFSECLFDPFKHDAITPRDYIIHNQWIYYLSTAGIVRQALSGTFGEVVKATTITEAADYDYIREIGGILFAFRIGSSPSLLMIRSDTLAFSIDLVNEVEDIIEWDRGVFAIFNVNIDGVEKCFFRSYDNISDFVVSPYILSQQTIYPDEIDGTIYELNNANEEESLTRDGITGNQFISCDEFLLIWNKNSNVIYRYDGTLFSYWENSLESTIADIRYDNGVVYMKDSNMVVYFSYDGLTYQEYYIEDTSNLVIANIYGNLLVVDNDLQKIYHNGILNDGGFSNNTSYGYYLPSTLIKDVDELTIPNGRIQSVFGFSDNGVIIDNIEYIEEQNPIYLNMMNTAFDYETSDYLLNTDNRYIFVNSFSLT